MSRWLDHLAGLLYEPLRIEGAALLVAPPIADEYVWISSLPTVEWIEGDEAGLRGSGGWLVPLRRDEQRAICLFLASSTPVSENEQGLLLAVAVARLAWRLQCKHTAPYGELPVELAEVIHEVRNGLNSVRMSSAVLLARVEALPETLRPIAETMNGAVNRSVQCFNRLCALIDPQV